MDNDEEQIQKLRERVAKIDDWLIIAEKRIIRLEAVNYEHTANFAAILKCLSDVGKIDLSKLNKTFENYQKEAHQKLLEKLEDVDPFLGATMDQRKPNKE